MCNEMSGMKKGQVTCAYFAEFDGYGQDRTGVKQLILGKRYMAQGDGHWLGHASVLTNYVSSRTRE